MRGRISGERCCGGFAFEKLEYWMMTAVAECWLARLEVGWGRSRRLGGTSALALGGMINQACRTPWGGGSEFGGSLFLLRIQNFGTDEDRCAVGGGTECDRGAETENKSQSP